LQVKEDDDLEKKGITVREEARRGWVLWRRERKRIEIKSNFM